jgi:hypothetical protein
MRTEEQKAQVEHNREDARERSRQYGVRAFGLADTEVIWYNSGICYDRIIVTTEQARDKVVAAVENKYVNGGMFHGMSLGAWTKSEKGFDIMC